MLMMPGPFACRSSKKLLSLTLPFVTKREEKVTRLSQAVVIRSEEVACNPNKLSGAQSFKRASLKLFRLRIVAELSIQPNREELSGVTDHSLSLCIPLVSNGARLPASESEIRMACRSPNHRKVAVKLFEFYSTEIDI